jgi:branched-chain amino acid transport system permease protein
VIAEFWDSRGRRLASQLTRELTPAQTVIWTALVIVMVLFPTIVHSSRFLDVAITYGIFAIALYGLGFLYGQTNYLSIAHSALMGVGAYTAAILFIQAGLGFWAVLPLAALLAMVAALLLGYPALRVSGYHFVIVTFAACELFVLATRNLGGAEARKGLTGGAQGLDITEPVGAIFGQSFDINLELEPFYYLVIAFLFITILVTQGFVASPLGRTFRAIRENEALARSVGIQANWYKILAFGISGLFAGVAGALFAYKLRHIAPDLFNSFEGVELALMVLLGGSRRLMGPLVGAIIVGFLPDILDVMGLGLTPFQRQIVFGALLIAVIILLPHGLVQGVADLYGYAKRTLADYLRPPPPDSDGDGPPDGAAPEPDPPSADDSAEETADEDGELVAVADETTDEGNRA